MRKHRLEIGDLSPSGFTESGGLIRPRVDDRIRTGGKIGNQVTRARTDAKTVTGESGCQNQARDTGDFTNAWNTIGRAIDETGPGMSDLRIAELG